MFASRAKIQGAFGAFFLCAAPAAAAQSIETSIDVGIVSLRYADSLNAAAATLTPDVRFDWDRGIAQVSGTFSQFMDGGWSAQAATSGSLFTPTRRGLLGELAAVAGGSTHQDGTRTGQALANLRLHVMRPWWGAFAGAGGGRTWDGASWRRLLLGELGAWMQNSTVTAVFTITPVSVDDSVRYLDGQLTLSRSFNRVDLTAVAGGRVGGQNPGVDTRARAWGSLSALSWIRPRVGVTASGGTYPVDPTQGFPGGRFIAASIRFATSQRRANIIPDVETPTPAPTVSAALDGFHASRDSSGSVVMGVSAPNALTVEISGDFNGWIPAKLTATGDGRWVGRFQLPPGKYQMNLRIDGGEWIVPPGLLPLKDEFGGSVGLLVVD